MAIQANMHEAKTNLSELIDTVLGGEHVVTPATAGRSLTSSHTSGRRFVFGDFRDTPHGLRIDHFYGA